MTPSLENGAPAPAVAAATPPPSDPPDAPGDAAAADAADAAAWADVLAGWDDEERHRAYLARFHDLEGLAAAGRRYRDVLARRPGDPVAVRFRDEVLKRAVAHGLASLPRAAPDHRRARLAVRVAAGIVIGALLLVAGIMVARIVPLVSAGARP